MKTDNVIAIIVEGENYEKGIINNLEKCFFHHNLNSSIYKIITLPAGMNIYMLWKRMVADEFEVDIIELVREMSDFSNNQLVGLDRNAFSEVYLFFDFDAHQDNLSSEEKSEDVVREMLKTFDNETENGKLYISYPMAEAIRDYLKDGCRAFSGSCYISYKTGNYKHISGFNNTNAAVKKYKEKDWNAILNCYRARLACMLEKKEQMSIEELKIINPLDIYNKQETRIKNEQKIMILSAFPEYLVDYFKVDFLDEHFK